jgi:hypothetical protein
MTQKKFQKGSKIAESLDLNGDHLITDQELMMKERLIRIENNDKKEDQQRYMVWFSMVTVTSLIIVVLIPGLIPVERLDHIGPILSTFLISNMGIIGTFIASSIWKKNGDTQNDRSNNIIDRRSGV